MLVAQSIFFIAAGTIISRPVPVIALSVCVQPVGVDRAVEATLGAAARGLVVGDDVLIVQNRLRRGNRSRLRRKRKAGESDPKWDER